MRALRLRSPWPESRSIKGCNVETNIIHFSVFTPSLSPGSHIAEHTYIKCSEAAAKNIIEAVSDSEESMATCLDVARFICTNIPEGTARFGGYMVYSCLDRSPTLDMYLLNGLQNGPRLSHIVCFVTDQDGKPVECTIYKLGEIRVAEKAIL